MPCGRLNVARMRFGLAGRPAFATRLRLQVQWPELIEADHDRLAGLRGRVELDDPVTLGLKVGSLERFQVLTA